jgi:hypothetical protein
LVAENDAVIQYAGRCEVITPMPLFTAQLWNDCVREMAL